MTIDSDINASQDINSYTSEQLADLEKSALGESSREFALNSEFMIFTFIFIFALIAIGAVVIILTKK